MLCYDYVFDLTSSWSPLLIMVCLSAGDATAEEGTEHSVVNCHGTGEAEGARTLDNKTGKALLYIAG
jgi:hypothetical protein